MLFQKLLLRIAWFMTLQQPFCKMEEKVFIDFIEIFQGKMKRVHVNKSFFLLYLKKLKTLYSITVSCPLDSTHQ